jgi:hypothetical protein
MKSAAKMKRILPLRAETMALFAHWLSLLAISKGDVAECRDRASDLATVYCEAFEDLIAFSEKSVVVPKAT